jgi:hypothetical protein
MVDGRLPWPLVFQVLAVAAAVWLVIATWTLCCCWRCWSALIWPGS